jgi:hypothetical protein
MHAFNWTQATPDHATNLIARAGDALAKGPLGLHSDTIKVELHRLSFYGDDARLVRFTGTLAMDETRVSQICALDTGHTLAVLAGKGDVIAKVNREIGFEVTRQNVIAYLQFFCFFVRGEDGPFYIIADETDPALTPPVRQAKVYLTADEAPLPLDDILSPPTVLGQTKAGDFQCTAMVYYHTAIFSADFTVRKDGTITMDDDDPLATDLPSLSLACV